MSPLERFGVFFYIISQKNRVYICNLYFVGGFTGGEMVYNDK